MKAKTIKGAVLEPVSFQGETVPGLKFLEARLKIRIALAVLPVMAVAVLLTMRDPHGPPGGPLMSVLAALLLLVMEGRGLWLLKQPPTYIGLTARGMHLSRLGKLHELPWNSISGFEIVPWSNLELLAIHLRNSVPDRPSTKRNVPSGPWGGKWDYSMPFNIMAARRTYILAACQFYHQNPEARTELGTQDCLVRVTEIVKNGGWIPPRASESTVATGILIAPQDTSLEATFAEVNRRIGYQFGARITAKQLDGLAEELESPISPIKIWQSQGLSVIIPDDSPGVPSFGCFCGDGDVEEYLQRWVESSPHDNLEAVLTYVRRELAAVEPGDEDAIPYGIGFMVWHWSRTRAAEWAETVRPCWQDDLLRPFLLDQAAPPSVPYIADALRHLAKDAAVPRDQRDRLEAVLKET